MKQTVNYYEYKELSAVVIIPIPKDQPVIILKDIGMPFYWEPDVSHLRGFDESEAIFNYLVWWKGKFYHHEIPSIVKKHYGNFLHEIIDTPTSTSIWIKYAPEGIFELPIAYLIGHEIKIAGKKYVTPVKEALRALEILKETRGPSKKIKELNRKKDEFVIKTYKNLKNARTYVKDIQGALEVWLKKKCPQEYECEDKQAQPYSDAKIRNIIRKYKKSSLRNNDF